MMNLFVATNVILQCIRDAAEKGLPKKKGSKTQLLQKKIVNYTYNKVLNLTHYKYC